MQTRPIPRAATRKKLESFGIEDQVQRKGYRGHPLSAADVIRNDKIAVTRSGGERPFATYKSRYGLARTRLMGLVRNMTFYGLAAIATTSRKVQSSFFTTACWRLNRWDKCAQNQEISNETQQINRRTTRKNVVVREIHT